MKKRTVLIVGLTLAVFSFLIAGLKKSIADEIAITNEIAESRTEVDTREVSGIVETIDIKNNLPCVFIVTSDGNRWAFIADGYAQGDFIMCKFDTCNTASVKDDILLAINGMEIK